MYKYPYEESITKEEDLKFEKVEEGVWKFPLILPPSLEGRREEFEKDILNAQRRMYRFAKKYGWEEYAKRPFADRLEIYDKKEDYNRRIIELMGICPETIIPDTFSAGLEKRVLVVVSPEIYAKNYPIGVEDSFFEKIMCHEIVHRLHVRILNGDEDAMGPIWFFEAFAIYGSDQFTGRYPKLSKKEVWEIVEATERGSYIKYASVLEYFMKDLSFKEMVKKAGDKDFIKWLKSEKKRDVKVK